MTLLLHIADKILNAPLLLQPEKAAVLLDVLGGRIGLSGPEMTRFEGSPVAIGSDGAAKQYPFMVKDGVGIVTIIGSLVNRGAWIGSYSGLTSYEGIQHQLKVARDSADVRAVLLDMQSPGGEVVGAFETATLVAEVAAVKQVVAVVNGVAASAAYLIASHASEIVTTDTGISGSIGVVYMHADMSRRLEDQGVKPTLIYAGAHKVDGNPYGPLPDAVRADIQGQVDAIYGKFVDAVASGRGGRISADMVRATEARVFTGAEAVAAGLADRTGTFETALSGLTSPRAAGRTTAQNKGVHMGGTTGAPAAENAGIFTQAQMDAALAIERTRVAGLDRLAAKIGGHVKGNEILAKARADGSSVEATALALTDVDAFAGAAKLAAMQTDDLSAGGARPAALGPAAMVTGDGRERFRLGAIKSLSGRFGLEGGERNEFSGMTLAELAREAIAVGGGTPRGMNRMDMVGMAFTGGFGMAAGMHSTSDFSYILQNVAQKSALKGYQEADETFDLWTSVGSASDFKPISRVDLGVFPALDLVSEGGEYKYGKIGDRGVTVAIATYGKIIAITRQAIINDDLSILDGLPRKMGRASKRTIGNLVYGFLNSPGNWAADNVAFFNAAHGNVAGSLAAPSETTLAAAKTAMGKQQDGDKNAVALNIQPKYFLSSSYEVTAKQLMKSTSSTADSKNSGVANPVQGLAEVLTDQRITGSTWFLAADPNLYDTVEITYLDGVQEPVVESQKGWSVDGTELKVRLDAGVNPLDFRGLYKGQ